MSAEVGYAAQSPWPARFRVVSGKSWSLRIDRRVALVTGLLAVLCLVAGIWSLTIGETDLSLGQVLAALLGHGSETDQRVVVQWRMPRTLMAVLGGGALGVSGALFQSLTRNPLGSPDIMGFTTGAYTGALVAMLVIGTSGAGQSIAALVGGLVTALAVYLLAYRKGVQGIRLIIVGLSVGAMLNATNSYLLIRADQESAVSAAAWGAGSLNDATWRGIWPLVISLLILIPVTVGQARPVRLLEMGDDLSTALGVPVERTRVIMLVLGVGFVAVITALAGPISFVALAAPQLARRVTGAGGVPLLASALMGALLLIVSDALARILIAPSQLPVGVVTSCLGGAYLLWLLFHQARSQ